MPLFEAKDADLLGDGGETNDLDRFHMSMMTEASPLIEKTPNALKDVVRSTNITVPQIPHASSDR